MVSICAFLDSSKPQLLVTTYLIRVFGRWAISQSIKESVKRVQSMSGMVYFSERDRLGVTVLISGMPLHHLSVILRDPDVVDLYFRPAIPID